jgi:hypothetical protein
LFLVAVLAFSLHRTFSGIEKAISDPSLSTVRKLRLD